MSCAAGAQFDSSPLDGGLAARLALSMLSFAAAVFFLILTPGPGVLSAAGVGAAFGHPAGLRYVFGLFLGNNFVILLIVTGLSALVLADPLIRTILFALSTAYLFYIALRIAFAGSKIAFVEARSQPGILAGFLLQPINPKAYAVNTVFFTGFSLFPDAFWAEVFWKILIVNLIWIPIHIAWVWFGSALKRLNLSARRQSSINVAMAVSMLTVVLLALRSV